MDNLFWREPEESEARYRVPDEIVDLVFRLRGERLEIDHAQSLAEALRAVLGDEVCARIGVHGIHLASAGNGWQPPEHGATDVPLPRRARLAIRVHRDDRAALEALQQQDLPLAAGAIRVEASSQRPLSTLGSLHARAIRCEREQSEPEFLAWAAREMRQLGIDVARMICGRSGEIRTADGPVFTRALLVADLKPEESVRLQQRGLGDDRLLGCGLFVPHKGIDPVYTAQE